MSKTARVSPSPYDLEGSEYRERVYAGVLGKIIGVYLGRPFEGWSHERIIAELGEIDHYVHERFEMPLIVTDDDIAGTFTFPRALADNGYDPDLSPARIGDGWLNYLINQRTVLWWGGLGVSSEHTAYLRLLDGIAAPESGSIARNGTTIAEQIGAQIFIDGWAMLFPGDPERAADWARRAASVSHDGEAIHGAQVIAAIEAQAFIESDIDTLLDTALRCIPRDSVIARLITDVREWHAASDDWYVTRARIGERYGYDRYPGACHMVPNHALIIMALLHGNGDFRRSLMIVNTAGWDTDCNSGNVGAILGIRDGLAAFDGVDDYRLPVADRLYLSTAEGGRGISDAVRETYHLVNAARALRGLAPDVPKAGARFHFSLPGSVQGFMADDDATASVGNTGDRLAITLQAGSAIVSTPTFAPEETRAFQKRGYRLFASPTLHPGQEVIASIEAPSSNRAPMTARLLLRAYDPEDVLQAHQGEASEIVPGATAILRWVVPALGNQPIQNLGLQVEGEAGDTLEIDAIGWTGAPTVTLGKGSGEGDMWRQAWVDGADIWDGRWKPDFQLSQNHGTGLIAQGTEDWRDYVVSARIRTPLAASAGIAARIGGMRRYYALVLREGGLVQLVKRTGETQVLAETAFAWEVDQDYELELHVDGPRLIGTVNGGAVWLEASDDALTGGSAGFVIEAGTLVSGPITITAALGAVHLAPPSGAGNGNCNPARSFPR
jgi:ADP-ribosylglycohydrolase